MGTHLKFTRMDCFSVRSCIIIIVLNSAFCYGYDDDPVTEWALKVDQIKKAADKLGYSNDNVKKIHPRAHGTNFFNVDFPCDLDEPKSVHHLRPKDIDVVGALGDSITAANGADATIPPEVGITYRGVSWSIGGDLSIEESLTLPNILRKWRPDLKGYSLGTGDAEEWFNAAVPGARARNIPDQARDIVQLMKTDNRTDFNLDWKVITIFIGGNDLCALRLDPDGETPEAYIRDLREGLDILHNQLPRTLVNVAEILPIWNLPRLKNGFGADETCRLLQGISCGLVSNGNETELKFVEEQTRLYQKETQDLIGSGRYDTRDDFTVVNQPFFRNTDVPYAANGQVDTTFFAPDCFHFSSKGHAMAANMLWRNMLEPVGKKTTEIDWNPIAIDCAKSEDFPYIYTNINSVPGWGNSAEPECYTTPVWVIAVICVLAGALFLETCVLLALTSNKKIKNLA